VKLLTKGHVDNGFTSTVLGGDVIDGPVESVKDNRCSSGVTGEDLDGDEVGLLGDTILGTTDSTSNVGSVAEGIGVSTTSSVVAKSSTATKVGMGNVDTAVYDISVRAATGSGVVDVASGARRLVGDGAKTPGSTRLGGQSAVRQLR
jgi:hypothetical protein